MIELDKMCSVFKNEESGEGVVLGLKNNRLVLAKSGGEILQKGDELELEFRNYPDKVQRDVIRVIMGEIEVPQRDLDYIGGNRVEVGDVEVEITIEQYSIRQRIREKLRF